MTSRAGKNCECKLPKISFDLDKNRVVCTTCIGFITDQKKFLYLLGYSDALKDLSKQQISKADRIYELLNKESKANG